MSVNDENEQLRKDVQELKQAIQQLNTEVEVLKRQKNRPVFSSGSVSQIGGFILGAIVLIGVLWF